MSFFLTFLLIATTCTQALTIPTGSQQTIQSIDRENENTKAPPAIPCDHTVPLDVNSANSEAFTAQGAEPAPEPNTSLQHEEEPSKDQPKQHLRIKRQDQDQDQNQNQNQNQNQDTSNPPPTQPPWQPAYWFDPCKSPAAMYTPGLTCKGGKMHLSDHDDSGYYEDTKDKELTEWSWGPWQDGEETTSERIRYGSYGWTQRCYKTEWSRWQCWYDYGGYTSYSWYE